MLKLLEKLGFEYQKFLSFYIYFLLLAISHIYSIIESPIFNYHRDFTKLLDLIKITFSFEVPTSLYFLRIFDVQWIDLVFPQITNNSMLEVLFSVWIKQQLHGPKLVVLFIESIGIQLILHIEFTSYYLATIFINYL